MTTSWIQSVAEKANLPAPEAELCLRRLGVTPDRALRPARRLTVTSIAFSGEKQGQASGVIDFSWSALTPGVWGLASANNLVGKSTVLEVLLWCLRGQPKGLQDDVRRWLRAVSVHLAIDGERHAVAFTVDDGTPQGTLTRLRPDDQSDIIDAFASDEMFAGVMARFMMRTLDLDPVPARQGAEGEKQTVEHGWLALSGGLYFGGDHKVLLGDVTWGGMAGRMLQMYVGLPWALTVMQAGTAQKELEQEASRAEKATKAARDTAASARERIVRDLEAAKKRRDLTPVEVKSVEDLGEQVKAVTRLTAVALELERALNQLKMHSDGFNQTADDDERSLRDLRENQHAAAFFNGLQPSCCPRCEAKVSKERIAKEVSSLTCSVCTEEIPSDQLEDASEQIAEADVRAAASRDAAKRHVADVKDATDALTKAQGELQTAQAGLASAASGEGFRTRRAAELEVARLEGALQERASQSEVIAPSPDAELVTIAALAAKAAFERDRGDLMEQLNAEILRLGKAFGIVGLEAMNLNHISQMKLQKGGEWTVFSRLTAGERLRLRIAAAIALIRVGRERGVGRHPGLLIIDSPGAEETNESDLQTLLAELNAVATETEGLQIFIASADAPAVVGALGDKRCRIAGPGKFLW